MTSATRTRPGAQARPPAWPVVCVLALVVVGDFQFRLRDNDQAVAGNADPFVLLEIATYASVALFLFVRFRPRPRLRRTTKLVYLGYAYAAVLALSSVYSPFVAMAVVRAGQVAIVVALFRCVALHTDVRTPHRIAHAFAVLMAASVVLGVLVPFPRLPLQQERFTWLHVHPVQAGEMLAIAVIVLAAYAITKGIPRSGPRWQPGVYVILLAICGGGLLATRTRGAVLGAAVGVAVVLWMRWRGARRFELIAVGTVLVALVLVSGADAIEAYFARGESLDQLATLNARTDLWEHAFRLVGDHPLYGYGLTASRGLFLESMGLGGGHNALVNLLVDTGILGALAWLALLAGIGMAAVRLCRRTGPTRVDGILVLAVLLGVMANSIFTEGLGAPASAAFIWLYLLLAWVLRARAVADTEDAEAAAANPRKARVR
ncbi:MAG: O-antigen ligase family protein [Thermocrispum sp.]